MGFIVGAAVARLLPLEFVSRGRPPWHPDKSPHFLEIQQMQNRTRKGFTLIELLIVVVIIGILAAIAIPKFAQTKEKAYITAMKSDLKNLVSANEAMYSDGNTYEDIPDAPPGSSGVTIEQSGTATGWSATASHGSTSVTCTIGVGTEAGDNPEGEPVCTTP
jgi:prepilin-type N-terminal cleavage/methylation domain-containing protein